ncbi:MAG: hypothetical protein LBB75_05315 [Oscillospiraceae bacterium]|jgi:glycerol kinase|nr:hypothetical protein [Oscillospiraceae bacterium]
MKKYILVLDAGTTSVKALVFGRNLELLGMVSKNVNSFFPGSRMVEQDPGEIYRLAVECGREVMGKLRVCADEIACAGIANQRTSWLMWDGRTREPLCNLVTWQDTRGAGCLRELVTDNEAFHALFPGAAPGVPAVYTPLSVASTARMAPGFARALQNGHVKWGNVDAWLLHNLTGGESFATSSSTAGNSTMLDMPSGAWAVPMAEFFGLRPDMLPEIKEENASYGVIGAEVFGCAIPVCSMVADQQAAMFAQGCFTSNVAKCTNGSGTFVNVNIGEEYRTFGGFYTTIAWKLGGRISYMFEGNSYTTGSSLEWAQKQLELYGSVEQLDRDAASVPDSNGVYFVPALCGLPAPYGDMTARASFMGISPGANRRHFSRAVLESVAFAACDVVTAFMDLGIRMDKLSVSGGVSNSGIVVQLMSNLLGMEIRRPFTVEATGYGCAALAATNIGWASLEGVRDGMEAHTVFRPDGGAGRDKERLAMWKKAVERSLRWLE